MYLNHLSAGDIAQRLKTQGPRSPDHEPPLPGLDSTPKQAAVLLPLFQQQEEWRLLFIRRAVNRQDRHSGEVAFPGGSIEAGDGHATAAALREAQEEIDLNPLQVELLGRLPGFRTSSNYQVTPVVGCIPWPLSLQPDDREVARVFSIPLNWLAQLDHHEIQEWRPPGYRVTRQVIVFQEYDGERLWGVSARITLSLLRALSLM